MIYKILAKSLHKSYNDSCKTKEAIILEEINSWQVPTPLKARKRDTENFPVEAFPLWFSNMVKDVSEMVQTPLELAANVGMTTISACLAQKAYVDLFGGVPTNIWTMTLLPAGGGKSPVCKYMRQPLRKTDIGKMLIDNSTPEQFARILEENRGKGVIIDAEGTLFDNLLADRRISYGIFLKAYDEEPYSYHRAKTDIYLENPSLTFGVCMQNSVFSEYYENKKFKTLKNNGFFDRFLVSTPKTKLGFRDFSSCRDKLEPEIQEKYDATVNLIIEKMKECESNCQSSKFMITITSEAKQAFFEFRQEIEPMFREDSKFAVMQQWLAKLNDKVIRLAGVLAVMEAAAVGSEEFKPEINTAILNHAILLGEYYLNEFLSLISDCTTVYYTPAEKLSNYIANRKITKITKRDLKHGVNATSGLETSEGFEKALKLLEEFGYVRIKQVKTKGPASTIVEVNPLCISRKTNNTVQTAQTFIMRLSRDFGAFA